MKYTVVTVGRCTVTDVATAVRKVHFTIKYPKIDLERVYARCPAPTFA
jgi:hypothetical protein